MPELKLVPNVSNAIPLDLFDEDGDGLYTSTEGLSLPIPTYDEEFAESGDTEGGGRTRSTPQNVKGSVKGWARGSTVASYWTQLESLQRTVEMCRRNKGFLIYDPDGAAEVTYVLESIAITEMPQQYVLQAQGLSQWAFEFTARPYGLLLRQTNYPISIVDGFAYDSISNQDWRFDAGSGTLLAQGGALIPTSTAEKRMWKGVLSQDNQTTIGILTGASVAGGSTGVVIKRNIFSATNELRARINFGSPNATLEILKYTGSETSLATGTPFPVSPGTQYWLRAGILVNTVVINVYNTDPNVETPPAPISSLGYTLTGGDATAWGDGVKACPGIRLVPQGTDWSWFGYRHDASYIESIEPVANLAVLDVPGSVSGLLELVVSDQQSIQRNHLEAYVDDTYFDKTAPQPTVLLANTLVVTGQGTQTTRTGAYNPNGDPTSVIRAVLNKTPQVVCSTGLQKHTGPRRIKAHVYAEGAGPIYCRLAWRVGDGVWQKMPWTVLPSTGNFFEPDLGVADLPDPQVAGQVWEGRVEAYSLTTGDALEVNYIDILPARRAAKAKTISDPGVQSLLIAERFLQAGNPTLAGQNVGGNGIQTQTKTPSAAGSNLGGNPYSWQNIGAGVVQNSDNNSSYNQFTGSQSYTPGNYFTKFLAVSGFGFSGIVPAGATILGVKFEVEKNTNIDPAIQGFVNMADDWFGLLKAGATSGSNRRNGAWWPYGFDGVITYGGPNDKFGTTISQADVVNSGFGCFISAFFSVNGTFGFPYIPTVYVDQVKCTVYYQESGAVTWTEASSTVTVDSTLQRAKRTTGGDTLPTGFKLAYPSSFQPGTDTGVAVTVYKDDQANETGTWRGGVAARVSLQPVLAAVFDIDLAASPAYAPRIAVFHIAVGGAHTLLQSVPFYGSLSGGRRIWLVVDTANNYWVYVGTGTSPTLIMAGNDPALGSSGAGAIYDIKSGAATPNRYYDDYEVWKPDYPSPLIGPSGVITVTDKAVFRPNGARPDFVGSYMKVNPAGMERRGNQLSVKARGNDIDLLPDDTPGTFAGVQGFNQVRVAANLTPRVALLGKVS